MKKVCVIGVGLTLALGSAGAASAQQVVLSSNNVIGASSVYDAGAGNQGMAFMQNGSRVTGTYGAGNIFNSQLTAPTQEQFSSGEYFLTGDGRSSEPTVSNPYVTVDLGGLYSLNSFTLYNTTNSFVNDRGTGGFTILGGNSITVDGNNGFTLAGLTTTLASGTLMQGSSSAAPLAQSFASQSAEEVRYIQFIPTSAAASNLYNSQSYGLNELKVFGGAGVSAVPEPASWAMMIVGFGLIGAGLRYRQRRTVLRYV